MALLDAMSPRQIVGRAIATVLLVCTAFASVGLTAPTDSLFTITIHPVIVNLALDIDIKFATRHFHTRWSALPDDSKF